MNTWQERWLDRWYRERPNWSNGTEEFHNLCAANIPRGSTLLEVGAGPTNKTSAFLASIGPTDGIDVDPDVKTNRDLRAAYLLTGSRYPFDDGTFDAAVSNYVAEHVADPVAHLREVFRVLRPNGVYIVRTPNLYHYVALVSAVTPHWFHVLVANRLRGLPPENHDPYPTCYRMNTEGALRRLARDAVLRARIEGPLRGRRGLRKDRQQASVSLSLPVQHLRGARKAARVVTWAISRRMARGRAPDLERGNACER
jgi:SAM-dependent methyltransferase